MNIAAHSLPRPMGAAHAQSGQLRFFVHGALFSTLFLAKFGFTFGNSFLQLALPLCTILLGWIILTSNARINARALALYGMFVCAVLLDAVIVSLNSETANFSLPSLALLIVVYGFFVFEPKRELDTSIVVDIYLKYTMAFALLGIFQYVAQFAGFRISSLSSLMPALKPILIEDFFNSNAIMEYGSSVVRTNAIFLREPSTLSQLLVTAMVVEVLVKKRFRFLPIYIVAYLMSFSGTGLLSLVVALILSAFFSVRDAMRLPLIAVCGIALVIVISVAAPSVANKYIQRIGEFNSVQSSAYFRYIAQGRAWSDMIDDGSILTGNGPGSFERTYGASKIASNAVLKLTHDYGVIPMLLCFTLIATTIWLSQARIISLLHLALFQLGGGTELNACFLIPMLILCVWGLKSFQFAGWPSPDIISKLRPKRLDQRKDPVVGPGLTGDGGRIQT